jgi:DNA-directed RNA polymerase subunit RPC12/RpoP
MKCRCGAEDGYYDLIDRERVGEETIEYVACTICGHRATIRYKGTKVKDKSEGFER